MFASRPSRTTQEAPGAYRLGASRFGRVPFHLLNLKNSSEDPVGVVPGLDPVLVEDDHIVRELHSR